MRTTVSLTPMSPQRWWQDTLTGAVRVALPWQTLLAFVRISTHPRASARPLTTAQAWDYVSSWLARPVVWVPGETERHAEADPLTPRGAGPPRRDRDARR